MVLNTKSVTKKVTDFFMVEASKLKIKITMIFKQPQRITSRLFRHNSLPLQVKTY